MQRYNLDGAIFHISYENSDQIRIIYPGSHTSSDQVGIQIRICLQAQDLCTPIPQH